METFSSFTSSLSGEKATTRTLLFQDYFHTTSNLLKHLRRQQNENLVEIHLTKYEPSAATEDGCGPTITEQLNLDFNGGQLQSTSYRDVMKLVAGYVVDEMLPILMTDSLSDKSLENSC